MTSIPSSNYEQDLNVKEKFQLSRFLVKWEMILVYILILINLVLIIFKTDLYSVRTVQSIVQSGMDLSLMVLGMIFVLMIGDIDVSAASTMVFSAMVMGLVYDATGMAVFAVISGLAAGALLGTFNGLLVAIVKMPAVIVTIATQSLFRGIVKIVLDVNVLKNYPSFFRSFYYGTLAGIPMPLIGFLAVAALFCIILHRSTFGRKLYMMGNNVTATQYSGISTIKTKIAVFAVMGFMAAFASILFVGRMGGGISSTVGTGYELDVIAICVLGGVSTAGGKGKVYGPIIATLIMAFLSYTLGLLGVDANSRKIVTGIILIIAVLIPNINKRSIANVKLRFLYSSNKNIEAVNIRTSNEVKELRAKIKAVNKDHSVKDKGEQIRALETRIRNLKSKCQETTEKLRAEQKKDAMKVKNRFK